MQRAATLFEPLGVDLRRRLSIGGIAESFGSTFLSSMSRNLDTLLSPGSSASLDQAPEVRSGSGAQKGRATRINHQGVQAEEHDEHNVGKTGDQRYALLLSIDLLMATPPLTVITLSWLHTAVWLKYQHLCCSCRTQQGEGGEEQPEFLPMFPWYSGKLLQNVPQLCMPGFTALVSVPGCSVKYNITQAGVSSLQHVTNDKSARQ